MLKIDYPKLGIRPTIDGRRKGIRESLEDQTMDMAKSAAALIEKTLKYPDGTPVKTVIADVTIGGVHEAAITKEKFDKENNFFISCRTLRNEMNLIFFTPKDRIYNIRNSFFIRSLIVFLTCLLISIGLSHKITHSLTKSIIKLNHCAKEISNGNYDVSISFDEKDEMNILAKTFTEAAQKIGKNAKKIKELAFSDSLTGVRNRHYLNQMLDNWPESIAYTGVIFCDLNKLKFTNDNYGHDAGDKLICNFANILRSLFQTEDIIRYGGDEFVIIIKGIAQDKFNLLLRDFDKINKQDDVPYASIGYLWDKNCTDLQNLINQAENKMYLDKNEFYKKYPEFHR